MFTRSLFLLPCLLLAVGAEFALEPRAAKTLNPGAPCSFESGPSCQAGSICTYNQNFKSVCSLLSPELPKNQPCKSDSNCATGRCVIIGDGRKVCGPARLGNKCFVPLDCQSSICVMKSETATTGVCGGVIGQGGFCDLSDRMPCPEKTQTDPSGGPSYKLQCVSYNGDAGSCNAVPKGLNKLKSIGEKCDPQAFPGECQYACNPKFANSFDAFVCGAPYGGSSCKSNSDCISGYCNRDPGFQPTCLQSRPGHKCSSAYDCFSVDCFFKNKNDKTGTCAKSELNGTCIVEKGVNDCKKGKCFAVEGNGSIGSCQ